MFLIQRKLSSSVCDTSREQIIIEAKNFIIAIKEMKPAVSHRPKLAMVPSNTIVRKNFEKAP